MKTKKIVSLMLAIIMVVGLLPMSAIAESGLLGRVTGGLFVDDTADPSKSYQYTVVGEDGSTKTVNLLGENAETGNKLVKIANAGDVYYVRENNYAVTGDNFLLVGEAGNKNFAMNKNGKGSTEVTVVNDPELGEIIRGDYYNNQWKIVAQSTGSETVYRQIINNDNDWLYIANGGTGLDLNNAYILELKSWDNNTFKLFKCEEQGWGKGRFCNFYIDGNGTVSVRSYTKSYTWDDWNAKVSGGTSFKWYQRRDVTENEYRLDTTALDKLIEEASLRLEYENTYTQSSWDNFMHALNAAKQVSEQSRTAKYIGDGAAQQALDNANLKYIDLQNAVKLLEFDFRGNGKCVTPHIDWERTNESTGLKKDVKTVESDASKNFPLVWKWNDIKDLTTDPNVTVWDVTDGLSAASWNKNCGGDWTTSSVRRFSGTFTWPHGYTLNDKAEIFSVNDGADKQGRYKLIYDYINSDPDLKARYGDSRVIPVNDDMYVFISKADENVADWNAQQAKDHMIFWTGTSGKGVWSNRERQSIEDNGDFGRPELASFAGISATPAFYGYYPNLRDINDDTLSAQSKSWKEFGHDDWMFEHTNYWYAMANTKATMSTLTGLYGADSVLDGQKMRIDVFAFDNNGSGGMDELQIKFCKPDENDVKVTVEYYLKNGDAEIKLDTTYLNAVNGTTLKLRKGTLKNELDYMKETASIKAGSGATVQPGRQEAPLVVNKNGENVIKVIYDTDTINTQYFVYDFAGKNEFVYDYGTAFSSVTTEGGINLTTRTEGTKIYLTYTPSSSKGNMETAQLIVNLNSNDSKVVTISFIPASNVLYEENFFNIDKFGNNAAAWNKLGAADLSRVVKDNQNTVYGYTDNYKNSIGVNGAYKTTVAPSGDKQFSDDLVFSFEGRGFDLIGSCAPTSGTVLVSVRKADDNSVVRNYVVDASYSGGEINQVPLVHCTDLPAGSYSVRVSGVNLDYGKNVAKMKARTFSIPKSDLENVVYNALVVKGYTPEEIANTEFISMDEKLNTSTFALKNDNATPYSNSNKDVVIDSFRVYRSSENAIAYTENERNVTYTNILKDGVNSNFTAYMESGNGGKVTVEEYRQLGGPANELYLMPHTAIAISVGSNVQTTQVSVRAVTTGTLMKVNEGSEPISINHNTEMYYEVSADNGVIVIANQGDAMLAIDNLKCDIQQISDSDSTRAVMMMMRMMNEPVPERFAPKKFDVKLNVINGLFNRFGTLRITASPDVQYVEINGVKTQADNRLIFNWGLAKNLKYVTRKNVKKGETITFTVVAYDNFGNASDPIVISK